MDLIRENQFIGNILSWYHAKFLRHILYELKVILSVINWQPLCAGQYGKCGILIGSEALTTGSLQTGIDIHSITTMLAASAINENKCE